MIIKRTIVIAIIIFSLYLPSLSFALLSNINYNIHASFDPVDHTVSGTIKIAFSPHQAHNTTREGTTGAQILLYPNIYTEKDPKISEKEYSRIYPRRFNSGHIEILFVKDSTGAEVSYNMEDIKITRDFNMIVRKNTILQFEHSVSDIEIGFKTMIPEKFGPFGHFKGIYTLAGGWHPYIHNLDTTSSVNYNITLTMPEEYKIAVPEKYIKTVKLHNGSKTLYIEADSLPYFDMAISRKFLETTIEKEGYVFSYYHLKKDNKYAMAAVEVAIDAADYFNKNFSEIKDKIILFAETYLHQNIVSSQENVILISNRFHKAYSYLRRFHDVQLVKGLYYKFWKDLIPVEEEEWVAEGLADYAAQRYILDKYKEAPSLSGYLKLLAFIPLFDEILYSKKLPMRDIYFKEHNHLVVREDIRLFYNNRANGSVIFQKLKAIIGKDYFDKIIEKYKNGLINGEYKGFRVISEEISNQDLNQFYNQWLYINPSIDFAIKSVKRRKSDEKYKTEISIEKGENGVEPVDIKIAYMDKSSDTYHWDGMDKKKKIEIESEKAVKSVELDPEKITSDPNRFNNRLPHRWKVLLSRFRISYDFQSSQLEFDLGVSTTRHYDDRNLFVFNVYHKEEVDGASFEYGYNFGGYNREDKPLHTLSTKLIFEKLSEKFAATSKQDEYINAVGLSYRYDTYRASVEYADKFLNGEYSYFKWLLDLRKELRIANKHSVAGRALIGESEGDLPEHTKFLLGGIQGMRGYTKSDYKGNNLSLFTLEYRFPIIYDHDLNLLSLIIVHTAQGVIFTDAGMVSDNRNTFKFKDYKTDVGAGLRFHVDLFGIYPGIGRIDFAIPVGKTEKSRNVHVYLSIGQSF